MALGLKVIEGVFNKLTEHHVLNSAKCARVRHKAATCTACMDLCAANAITVTSAGGKVLTDWSRCSGCGKCLTACKNGVFTMRPTDKARLFSGAAARIKDNGLVTLSCRQSPHAAAAVYSAGSLAVFHRNHLLRLASMGAGTIILVTGDCAACGRACSGLVTREIAAARQILSLCGHATGIRLTDTPGISPPTNNHKNPPLSAGTEKPTSRREFFGYLKTRTMASVGSSITYLTETEADDKPTVLTSDSKGTERAEYLATLQKLGGEALLADMTKAGLLNEVAIDRERCSLCAVCSRMCPNGVFTAVTATIKGRQQVVDLQCNSLYCTGCGVCTISCPGKAINLTIGSHT